MKYTLTIYYQTLGTRRYYNLSLEKAVNSARLAVALGNDFDIKESE